jgi:hypothetical protein
MFNLPKSTEVKRFIAKNAFDAYTNSKQKKLIADKISKMTWLNKISFDTVNLQGILVEEIQIFEIELKEEYDIQAILSIIDKSIPYTIIFVMRFGNSTYLSTSVKHINPHNIDNAVIDYTFTSNWFLNSESTFRVILKNDLDWVFKEFCEQFSNVKNTYENIYDFIEERKSKESLEKEIQKLKTEIFKSKQFNKKVELNLQLKNLEMDLLRKYKVD